MEEPVKNNRPPASGFWQQRLSSFDPVITPFNAIAMFFVIGIFTLCTGISVYLTANSGFEMSYQYGGSGTTAATLAACTSTATCSHTFTLDQAVDTDLYVSYELDNFYQNQIEYQAAVDWYQIMGTQLSTEDECGSDFFSIGNQTYSPCGLIANSFFNDYFTLDYTNSLINGATPASDMKRDAATITSISTELFKQPEGFKKVQVANSVSCSSYSASDCTSAGLATNCKCYAGITSQTWLYFYPDDDTTRYLYESYPTAISPLEGVTNPHFMNWMDVASFAKFRKLYGKISGPFKKGDTLKFTIDSQYNVDGFDGKKSLVISTRGDLGPNNYNLGVVFLVLGSITLFMSIVFFLKQQFAPRALGTPTILNWKSD